jgi:hypothetical protein
MSAAVLAAAAWAVTVVLARAMGNGPGTMGLMNLAVMAALAVVIFAEKLWRYGKPFGQAVGVLLVAAGILAIWFPWLLPGLHTTAMPAM